MSHPGAVPIATTERNAPVRLDALGSAATVVSYDKAGGARIRRKGYLATIESAERAALLRRITTTDGHRLAADGRQRLLARWSARPGVAVYLMRSVDDLWRVGTADLHPDAQGYDFGPARRATDEGAAAQWILTIEPDEKSARTVERATAVEFGITERCFRRHRALLASGMIDLPRPVDALRRFRRDPASPFWRAGERSQRGCRAAMTLAASNLLPGWMQVATDDGSGIPRWLGFDVEHERFDGPLFSVAVEKYHHYVADGIVVRDSIEETR